jgi:hypothetical protein
MEAVSPIYRVPYRRLALICRPAKADRQLLRRKETFVEIPVTVAAAGAILAHLLAAIGAISAMVAKFTIVVVRSEPKPPEGGAPVT